MATIKKFDVHMLAKNDGSLTSFSRYCKDQTCYFVKNFQKINFITHFFLKILKRNSKFVIFGNAWSCKPKMIVSI